MKMDSQQTLLLQALNLWKEITGVDPDAISMKLSSWHLRETFDELQEAIDLDATEITANLLLMYFINTYLADNKISLLNLIENPEEIEERLLKPRKLLAILNRPEITNARDRFIKGLQAAMHHYAAEKRDDVAQLIGKHDSIAILRRDALRSMQNLRVDQFLNGSPESADIQPVYNRTVHQWWNINSMLAAATRMPSGVSLNLIRHPDAFQSYFCFMIRNGGNLFVLSDIENYSHPLQGFMSRRPDRELNERAARNWFPYKLLGLEYDEESKQHYIKESAQRSLVAYQNEALPLQPVAELPAAELVWISMMFELILEKFWHHEFKAPALSYTAEMLQSETALLEAAKKANLPVPTYQPAGLSALTKDDIRADACTEEEIGKKYHEPNRWLEERYADRVPDNLLNLLGTPEQVIVLEDLDGKTSNISPKFHTMPDWQKEDLLCGRARLDKVDATSFGNRTQVEADRKFIARSNFATHIDALAKQEYEARKDDVLKWYHQKVEANVTLLLQWCSNTELWVDDGVHPIFSHYESSVGAVRLTNIESGDFRGHAHMKRRFFDLHDIATDEKPYNSGIALGQRKNNGQPPCYLNGTKASYWALFYPGNAEELALLAGCMVTDLPDVLQHWSLLRKYTGNSILSRVDPMIWQVTDPWLHLNLAIKIGLSKRAMAKIKQQQKIRPDIPNLISESLYQELRLLKRKK